MSRYLVKIYTPQELNHSSYVQTGLFELEQEGFIKTNVKLSFNKRLGTIRIINNKIEVTNQAHPKTSFYQLEDIVTGKVINFATDLYDAAFSFSKYALDNCDYIFKRNYETRYINKISEINKVQIKKFGLSFGVYSDHKKSTYLFFWGMIVSNFLVNIKLDRLFFKRLKNCFTDQLEHWRFVQTTRNIKLFESFSGGNNNKILFQTRCFPNEIEKDTLQIHQQRFRIVKLLRNAFKDKFIGGIIPSPLALENYAPAISDLPADSNSYLAKVKHVKYVIYTRGLTNSPAWKLAEYLSQGKVIIAETITAELPISMEHKNEILYFNREADIVNLIEEVMNDEELAQNLTKNARSYFEEHVHPKQNMKRIINFLIEKMENG